MKSGDGKPICVWRIHNVGEPRCCLALLSAFSSASRSSPISPSCTTFHPYEVKRATTSSEHVSAVLPSIVILLSSYTQISRSRPRCPANEAASWLMPSIKQPSPAMTNVWWSINSEPKRARRLLSAIAMPTALAKPCPSGPVVTSTPAV